MIYEKEIDNDMNSLPMVFMGIMGKVYISLKNWLLTIPVALYITTFLDTILQKVGYHDILLPLILGILTLFIYFMVAFFDFITGMKASSHTNEEITSKRLWRTLFKIGTVCLINLSLSMFAAIFVILDVPILSTSITILIPSIMLTIVLFEIYSIGENFETFLGYKPRYFGMIDRMAELMEKGILNKIKKYFE